VPRAFASAAAVVVSVGLLLTGCSASYESGAPSTDEPGGGTPELTAQEDALLAYLRTAEIVRDDLAEVPDAELLDAVFTICEVVRAGDDLDSGMRALTEDFPLHDETIAALAIGAQVTYCPDRFDATAWASESPFMRERLFLRTVREQAGRFSQYDDATAFGLAGSVCQAFAEGESVETIVSALHSGSPTGMAPDPEGARAFIAASIVAFCPDADIWQ
jgi:hypothetical protein